ncbi:hypothetical protein [Puniceicoccus vermicola]|uniref:Uncharacterized protein n=1 Tax=Puniceicoccus vermicola TaxID=388746 RepID=A0A7X1AVK7_9BACT|nr:hypothetical protein [Puniceicoccus vermicola]MBC2600821.1 hypothetical protein [Puniceicoccus vermicola]
MAIRLSPGDRIFLAILAVLLGFLVIAPIVLSADAFQRMFAEDGFFETLSFYGWIAGAVLIFVRVRPLGFRAVSFALLSLALAAREADWHKKFTTQGALKINFYLDSSAPLMERLIAGLIVLILIAGMVYAFYAAIRFLFFEGGWSSRSALWLFATGVLLVASKCLDRLPAELNNLFDITLSQGWVDHLQALEEGLETVAPLVFLWSIWLSGIGRSYLARKPFERGESIS